MYLHQIHSYYFLILPLPNSPPPRPERVVQDWACLNRGTVYPSHAHWESLRQGYSDQTRNCLLPFYSGWHLKMQKKTSLCTPTERTWLQERIRGFGEAGIHSRNSRELITISCPKLSKGIIGNKETYSTRITTCLYITLGDNLNCILVSKLNVTH
jgi:hypothetical protein